MKRSPFSAVAFVFCMMVFSGCSSQSSEQIAKDLSNKMTDDMAFTGGSKVDGTPPQTTQGAPLVTDFNAAGTLYTGKSFEVTLFTDYQSPSSITGAYVYVTKEAGGADGGRKPVGADQYIVVNVVYDGGYTFKLSGTLGDDDKLSGEKFILKLGLFDSKGVGNYVDWPVAVDSGKCADMEVCSAYCKKSTSCGSEETLEQCMSGCGPNAVKYLATLQMRMTPCAAMEVCDEAYNCWLDTFNYCPDAYDAKHAYCAKKKECDSTVDLDLCYATEGENPKWADTNCMCVPAVDDYKTCLGTIACSSFGTELDAKCASLIPNSPRNQ